jgi:endonuclease G, mitochondrial
MSKIKFSLRAILSGLAMIAPIVFFSQAKAQTSTSVHLTMGNPSGALTNTSFANNYLLVKPQYALSYNNSRLSANWVSWQLNSSWLGSAPRQDDFRADTTLPSSWYRVVTGNFTGSGFDRGHMTPSADRTSSVTNNSATFLMTNIVPQAPDNNQGPWARLEDYQRTLVGQGKDLYVISGGYGSCGTGSNGSKCSLPLANGQSIGIYSRLWKVIVVVNPGTGLNGVTSSTRVIAVDMPNTQGIRNVNWGTYRVSVDSIESKTGFNLLSLVTSSIQSTIESRIDTGATN